MKGIKTGGRSEGTPNRLTSEMREVLKTILEKEIDTLPNQLEKLEPKERLEIVVKLLPYVIPRITEIEMKVENKQPTFVSWNGKQIEI